MPMIDVDLPEGLVPVGAHARLAGDLQVQPRTAVHTAALAGRTWVLGAAGAAAATP